MRNPKMKSKTPAGHGARQHTRACSRYAHTAPRPSTVWRAGGASATSITRSMRVRGSSFAACHKTRWLVAQCNIKQR